MIMKEELL